MGEAGENHPPKASIFLGLWRGHPRVLSLRPGVACLSDGGNARIAPLGRYVYIAQKNSTFMRVC